MFPPKVTRARCTLALASITLCCTAACESLEDRARYLTGPDAITWYGSVLSIPDTGMRGQVLYRKGGSIVLSLSGFPPGTRVTFAGKTAEVNAEGELEAAHEAPELLGALNLADIARRKAELTGVVLTFAPPNMKPFDVTAGPIGVHTVTEVLRKATTGPVRFVGDGEKADDAIGNVIWLDAEESSRVMSVIGAPATLVRDVDAVVTLERKKGPTRVCTGYISPGQPGQSPTKNPDINLSIDDGVVTVYSRRTGKVVATKTFTPSDACPNYARAGITFLVAELPMAAIESWLFNLVNPPAEPATADAGEVAP